MNWILCKDKLPEPYQDILVTHREGKVYAAQLTLGGYWRIGRNLEPPGSVIAWMPYPEPWKGGEDGPERKE